MSNDNTQPGQFNDDRDGNVIIVIDGREIVIDPRQLLDAEILRQLEDQCQCAQNIIFRGWERVLTLPDRQIQFLVNCATADTSPQWQFSITDANETYSDPFSATLALEVPSDDLRGIGRAQSVAVMAAAATCPDVASEAARRIKRWLESNAVQADPITVIAARIRRDSPASQTQEGTSPQDGARQVLAHLQSLRDAAGETEIETPPVRYFQSDYWSWTGANWAICDDFENQVVRILQHVVPDKDLTTNFINSVCRNIQGMTLFSPPKLSHPIYVREEQPLDVFSCHMLGLQNGDLDFVQLLQAGQGTALRPHDPRVFGAPLLPYAFDGTACCPLWRETLRQVLLQRDETDRREDVLQEFFGYCLMPWHHRLETCAILIGNGANGKSVILAVLRAMLGQENVSDVPLDALGGEFRLSDMRGKLANVATDMQRMQRVQEGILKQLVSGEPVQINRKYKAPVTMFPTAKLVFASNHLPPFADTSDGLWRRMQVIPFYEQFSPDRRDVHRAFRIIQTELPGVLNWAIEGATRLLSQGDFTRCEVCESIKLDHRRDSDPFAQFIDECCEIGPNREVLVDEAYAAYRGFCEASGKKPKAKSEFGKQVAQLDGVQKDREARVARRYYVYRGIGLLPTVMGPAEQRRQEYQSAHRVPISHRPHDPSDPRSSPEVTPPPVSLSSPGTLSDAQGCPTRGMNLGHT